MPKVAKRRPFPLGWVAAPEMGRGLLLRGGEPRPQGLSTVVPVGMVAMITMSPASTLLAPITVASLMINGMILVLLLGLLSTFLVFGMRTFSRAWLLALLIAPVAWNLCLGLMDTKACATLVQRDKLNHDAVRFGYLWAGVVHATVPHMSLTRRFCVGAWFQLIMGVGGTFAFFVQMGDVRFGRIPLLNVCIPSLVGFCVARLVRHDDDATVQSTRAQSHRSHVCGLESKLQRQGRRLRISERLNAQLEAARHLALSSSARARVSPETAGVIAAASDVSYQPPCSPPPSLPPGPPSEGGEPPGGKPQPPPPPPQPPQPVEPTEPSRTPALARSCMLRGESILRSLARAETPPPLGGAAPATPDGASVGSASCSTTPPLMPPPPPHPCKRVKSDTP